MCGTNGTYVEVARTSNYKVTLSGDFYYCLMPQSEDLCTGHAGIPIATVRVPTARIPFKLLQRGQQNFLAIFFQFL